MILPELAKYSLKLTNALPTDIQDIPCQILWHETRSQHDMRDAADDGESARRTAVEMPKPREAALTAANRRGVGTGT